MVDAIDENKSPVDSNFPSTPNEIHLAERITEDIERRLLIFDKTDDDDRKYDEDEHIGRLGSTSSIEDAVSAGDNLSIVSIPSEMVRVKFDILTTKLINSSKEKYTVYVIMIMEIPKLDSDRAIIERRYSDFEKLHKGLLKECPYAVRQLPFPKKKFFASNFEETVVEERSRCFEKYLRFIYHQPHMVDSKAFQTFFFLPHLKEATNHLKLEENQDSYEQYRLAYQLQKKLGSTKNELVASMCGVVETCKSLKRFAEAEEYGTECLELLQFDVSNVYLLPLIYVVIDCRRRLFMNTDGLMRKLSEIQRLTCYDVDSIETLKEISVRRF